MFHVLVQDGITYMCMAEQVGMALSPPPPLNPHPHTPAAGGPCCVISLLAVILCQHRVLNSCTARAT